MRFPIFGLPCFGAMLVKWRPIGGRSSLMPDN